MLWQFIALFTHFRVFPRCFLLKYTSDMLMYTNRLLQKQKLKILSPRDLLLLYRKMGYGSFTDRPTLHTCSDMPLHLSPFALLCLASFGAAVAEIQFYKFVNKHFSPSESIQQLENCKS
jgi:hypothetical protein